MTPKDLTFKLVKSLTPSEKRYFQLFASITEGEKNYLLIFEEMDKMEKYDEKRIKEKFKNKKLIHNFTFEKLYLQKMILKALRNYRSADESSYVTQYADLEILIEKGIPEIFDPFIKKYKKLTVERKQWLEHLMFTNYEYTFAAQTQNSKWFEEKLEDFITNEDVIINQLKTAQFLKNTYNMLILIMRREKFSSPKRVSNQLKQVFSREIFDELKPKLNIHDRFYLHILFNTYLVLSGNIQEAIELGHRELNRVYKNKDEFHEVGLSNYLLMANNHAKNTVSEGMFSEAVYHANKMYEILHQKKKHLKHAGENPNLMFWIEINIMAFTLSGDFEKTLLFYQDNQKMILELGNVGGKEFQTVLNYYRALSEFSLGHFDEALDMIDDVKTAMQNTILSSESQLLPVLYMMCHLELGNFQYIENFMRSFKRYFEKNKVELDSITVILKIFQGYIKYYNTSTLKLKCKEWLVLIHKKSEDIYEHNFIRKTLIRQWLLSKYHQKSMKEITKADAQFFRFTKRRKDDVLLFD